VSGTRDAVISRHFTPNFAPASSSTRSSNPPVSWAPLVTRGARSSLTTHNGRSLHSRATAGHAPQPTFEALPAVDRVGWRLSVLSFGQLMEPKPTFGDDGLSALAECSARDQGLSPHVKRVTRTPIRALDIRAHQRFRDEERTFSHRHDSSRREAQRSAQQPRFANLNSRANPIIYTARIDSRRKPSKMP
jgi:hypothetical protein